MSSHRNVQDISDSHEALHANEPALALTIVRSPLHTSQIYSEDGKTPINPPTLQAANPPPAAPPAEAKAVPPTLTADAPKPAAGEGSTPPKQ